MKRQVGQPYTDQSVRTLMLTQAYSSGTPVRSQSEIARIWVAPYLDTDGDLNDQSFTYVVLNQGDWLIAHNGQQIINEYRPIRLLGMVPKLQAVRLRLLQPIQTTQMTASPMLA